MSFLLFTLIYTCKQWWSLDIHIIWKEVYWQNPENFFQGRSFLEGKIQKNGKNFFKKFYCSKTFVSKWFIKYLAHINIEHTITISLSVLLKINLFFLKFDKLTNTVLVQLLILTSSFCLYLKVRLIKFAHDVLAKQ